MTSSFGREVLTPSCYDSLVEARAQPVVTFKPPKWGKWKKMYWTIWSTLQKKKVNAAYIRLVRYFMNIYRYTNLFRKALQSHIIPYNSYWYHKIPRQLFLFTFWDCFWKCKTQILIVLCSIYTQGCTENQKDGNYSRMWRSRFSSKDSQTQFEGRRSGEQSDEKKKEKKRHT